MTLKRLTRKAAVPRLRGLSSAPATEPHASNASAREALAVNIIRLRGARGWSQEALAFETGLHRTFIAHVERRKRNISLDNIEKIARVFGIQAHELLKP